MGLTAQEPWSSGFQVILLTPGGQAQCVSPFVGWEGGKRTGGDERPAAHAPAQRLLSARRVPAWPVLTAAQGPELWDLQGPSSCHSAPAESPAPDYKTEPLG